MASEPTLSPTQAHGQLAPRGGIGFGLAGAPVGSFWLTFPSATKRQRIMIANRLLAGAGWVLNP